MYERKGAGRGVLMAWCFGQSILRWIDRGRYGAFACANQETGGSKGHSTLNLHARSFSEVKLRSPENVLRSRHSILG
jgi:hypothetical protein